MDSDIFLSFGFLLMHVDRSHRNLVRRQMHALGLCRGQPPVLFALHKKDGMSNSELAEFLEITPATLTNKVKRMEKAGLVIRQRDEDDERVSRIYLTDKSRSFMDRLHKSMIEMESAMLKGFSDSEIQRIKADIRKILENIEVYQAKLD